MQNKPIRILQIVYSLDIVNGVLSVVLNWHHHIDTTKIQFDYLYCVQTPATRQREIEELGGKVYQLLHPYRHPFKFLYKSYQLFKTHHYRVIHLHLALLNFFICPVAKWLGSKQIIQHAHGTKWSSSKWGVWRNHLGYFFARPFITHKLACSQAAGEFWYGKNFTLINNGIEIEKFTYDLSVRARKREELGLKDNFVIAHVGRFVVEKNHTFLIDVFEQVLKQEPKAKLVLVGNGFLEQEIKNLVANKKIEDKVLFLGTRNDVPELLQSFDVLCLPSIFEGLPVIGVEAQAAGLPCVFADSITPEVLLTPFACRIPLAAEPPIWAKKILSFKGTPRSSGEEYIRAKGFDIRQTAKQMQIFYEELGKKD